MVIKGVKNSIYFFLVLDQINKERLDFVMKKIDLMFQLQEQKEDWY